MRASCAAPSLAGTLAGDLRRAGGAGGGCGDNDAGELDKTRGVPPRGQRARVDDPGPQDHRRRPRRTRRTSALAGARRRSWRPRSRSAGRRRGRSPCACCSPVPLAEPRLAAAVRRPARDPRVAHLVRARRLRARLQEGSIATSARPAAGRARRSTRAAGLAWNATALDTDAAWPEQRYLDYLAAIDTADELEGVGGAARVGYSPGAHGAPARELRAPPPLPPRPAARAVRAQPLREGRPVAEARGGRRRRVRVARARPVPGGRRRRRGDPARRGRRRSLRPPRRAADRRRTLTAARRARDADEACTIGGGGPIYVAVVGATAARAEVSIEYLAADVADPKCLDGEMPRDAVLVKADWRRQLPGELLPVYDSSGARMATRLAGDAAWDADGTADPGPADIYTVQLPNGARFRMPALHVMTKELDHWAWITLWWSPSPDTDFGADRPAALAALPGPWRNYKMCVSTSYIEGDPDPRGGFGGSLGDALAAVHRGVGAPSWCSNPYLEQGTGNAGTNCIGCHQHGGTTLTPGRDPRRPAAPRRDARPQQLLHRLPLGPPGRQRRGPVLDRPGRGRLLGRERSVTQIDAPARTLRRSRVRRCQAVSAPPLDGAAPDRRCSAPCRSRCSSLSAMRGDRVRRQQPPATTATTGRRTTRRPRCLDAPPIPEGYTRLIGRTWTLQAGRPGHLSLRGSRSRRTCTSRASWRRRRSGRTTPCSRSRAAAAGPDGEQDCVGHARPW